MKILFWNASTAKHYLNGIKGDWTETWQRVNDPPVTHPHDPAFLDALSLNAFALPLLQKYARLRNTNDGRLFKNKHSLDAFHPHAQNHVDVEAKCVRSQQT